MEWKCEPKKRVIAQRENELRKDMRNKIGIMETKISHCIIVKSNDCKQWSECGIERYWNMN